MDGMDDIQRMKPVVPMHCPRCCGELIFVDENTYHCKNCGDLYYDEWLGIWRVRRTELSDLD